MDSNSQSHWIYLEAYKEWLSRQDFTPNTLRVYHSRIKQFLLFLEYSELRGRPLEYEGHLKEGISLYISFLKETDIALSSVNANLNALLNFSRFLGIESTQHKREQCSTRTTRILGLDDQAKFLGCVQQQESARDRALALILFYTGLRIGECFRLEVGAISIKNDSTLGGRTGGAWICLGSGVQIQLNESTRHVLHEWLEERKNLPNAELQSGLWLTKHGRQLSISAIAFVIRRIGWQARLIVSAEMLRRTHLANATCLPISKQALAAKFGGYISLATVKRYDVLE